MPSAFIYLGILLLIVCVWFLVFKRPVYEAVLLSFIVLIAVTGKWSKVGDYIDGALSTSLLYSMVAFVAMSMIMTKTKILDSCVGIILSLLGRFTGGAGYVTVAAASFMGALSGSGPANVMTTGVMTIPAMKKSGFPPELAANIQSNSSYLGNMIPPSNNILAALEALAVAAPLAVVSQGQFWIIMWGLSLWFIIQRVIMVLIFCKHYKVKPIPKEELPRFRDALKAGWQGLLLPVIIIAPFLLDYLFKDTFFTSRLGAKGASQLSKSLLLFVAGLSAIITCLLAKDKKQVSPHSIAKMFADGVKSIAPTIGVCVFGYMIGELFADLNVTGELEVFFASLGMGKLWLVIVVCIITCILGMIIPGSTIVVTFGPLFITMLMSVGVNPVLAAGMLPCICGVMCGITPPLGLGIYTGMALAESDFDKTIKNNMWWVAAQFILQIIVLMGWLPIIGL